jgi:hypothetical protein
MMIVLFSFFTLFMLNCQPAKPVLIIPQLQAVSSQQHGDLTLFFDHDVELEIIELDPRLSLTSHNNSSIKYEGGEPGVVYTLQAKAKKDLVNLHFNTDFYDMNPNPATLQLNEIAIIHDKNRSNAIELIVTKTGNVGGITLLVGHNQNEAHRFVFPNREVQQGEYLVVDVRRIEGEFSFADTPGIPNTRGIIALLNSPYGPINEVFVYERSDRTEALSTQKTQFAEWHTQLVAEELWQGEPFDSRYATATRSVNRIAHRQPPYDANDWYITVTRGLTLGQPNNPERFKPTP